MGDHPPKMGDPPMGTPAGLPCPCFGVPVGPGHALMAKTRCSPLFAASSPSQPPQKLLVPVWRCQQWGLPPPGLSGLPGSCRDIYLMCSCSTTARRGGCCGSWSRSVQWGLGGLVSGPEPLLGFKQVLGSVCSKELCSEFLWSV